VGVDVGIGVGVFVGVGVGIMVGVGEGHGRVVNVRSSDQMPEFWVPVTPAFT